MESSPRLASPATAQDQLLARALVDPIGFLRERAVVECARRQPDWALSYVVPRLNDWVPQVRRAAREAVAAYLVADRFEQVLDVLPALQRLRRGGRVNLAGFVGEIELWLARHRQAPSLLPMIVAQEASVGHAVFDLLLRNRGVDPGALAAAGLRARGGVTRLRAAELAVTLPREQRDPLIARLLRTREPAPQLTALQSLPSDEARAAADDRLFHPVPAIRLWAEAQSGLSPENLAARARALLTTGDSAGKAFAVAARLAGERRDGAAEHLLRAAYDRGPDARRGLLLLAMTRVAPGRYLDEAVAGLTHPVLGIARAAAVALNEQGHELSLAEWTTAARRAPSDRHAKLVLTLARRQGKWHHLGVILELGRNPDRRPYAWSVLPSWLDRWASFHADPPPALRPWLVERRAGLSPPDPRAWRVLSGLA